MNTQQTIEKIKQLPTSKHLCCALKAWMEPTGLTTDEVISLAEELERMKMQLGNAYRFLRGGMEGEQDGDPIFRRSEWSDMVKQLQQALKENPND